MKNILMKIEDNYLQLFKLVLIIVLSSALGVSGVYLASALKDQSTKAKTPEAGKIAAKPNVTEDEFLNEIIPKPDVVVVTEEPKKNIIETPSKDRYDLMVDLYMQKMWGYVERYQKECSIPTPVDKETFLSTFPSNFLKEWFVAYGNDFAVSQDRFVKSTFENPRVIKMCKDSQGKSAILIKALDSHKNEWEKQLAQGAQFEASESERVIQFIQAESNRVAMQKLEAEKSFMIACYSFGVFMLLALLLIFSKIESNLRRISAWSIHLPIKSDVDTKI